MAYTISKGLAYIITLYTITSLGVNHETMIGFMDCFQIFYFWQMNKLSFSNLYILQPDGVNYCISKPDCFIKLNS